MIKSDILGTMRNTANNYFAAYSRCMEQRKIDLKTFQWLPIQALTCIAFSCEIYLKALILYLDTSHPANSKDYELKKLFKPLSKKHNLKELFNLLPVDTRENIKASYKNPLEFDKELNIIKEYFITSRYLYENETAYFSFPFIEWFQQKLKEVVDNQLNAQNP